jgi:hypothetical protein
MELSVIPGLASERAATLWFGVTATQAPPGLQVFVSGRKLDLPASRWRALQVPALGLDSRKSPRPFWYFRHQLDALASNAVYRVQAQFADGSARTSQAVFRTLPARLPRLGVDAPLRMDLRSCFYVKNGRATARRPRADLSDPPHLKVLCGDQEYLDLPVIERPLLAEARFLPWLDKYRENWSLLGGSFASLLGQGANLFVSDDHEFWNNYPYGAIYKLGTWGSRARDSGAEIARALFQAFQVDYEARSSGIQGFDIGPPTRPDMSVRALDCRDFRTRREFAPDADIKAICTWLAQLKRVACPGVLILSQPLFEPAVNRFDRRARDAGLADFPASYDPLIRAIRAADRDLLLLSGDIHCGRVSAQKFGGATVYEVVSSPVALVARPYHDELPGGAVNPPKDPVKPGLVRCDQHALLDFSRVGAKVNVKVRFQALGESSASAPPMPTVPNIELS